MVGWWWLVGGLCSFFGHPSQHATNFQSWQRQTVLFLRAVSLFMSFSDSLSLSLSLFLSHSRILHSIGRYWRAAEICSASTSVLHRARATQSHSTDHSFKALCRSSYHWVRSYNHMLSHLHTITRVMNTESGVCLCFLMNCFHPDMTISADWASNMKSF